MTRKLYIQQHRRRIFVANAPKRSVYAASVPEADVETADAFAQQSPEVEKGYFDILLTLPNGRVLASELAIK